MVTGGRIVVELVLADDGDEIVEVETSGGIPFVTALGMLRIAELHLVDLAAADDDGGEP